MAVSRFAVVVIFVINYTFLFVYLLPLFTENGLSSQPTRSASNSPKEGVLWLSRFVVVVVVVVVEYTFPLVISLASFHRKWFE